MGEIKVPCTFETLFAKNVPHILETIFFSLDLRSFEKCQEVSNSWRDFLRSESFQKKAKSVAESQSVKDEEEKLYNASCDGEAGMAQKHLSSPWVNVNCMPYSGVLANSAPLHIASRKGHKDVVKILLDGGADPKKENSNGDTPLSLAKIWATPYRRLDIIVKLLQDSIAEK